MEKGKAIRIKPTALSPGEARKLLQAIPLDTVEGLRDYAMFLTALAIGARKKDVVQLTWQPEMDLPPSALEAIHYLAAANRLTTIQENEFIFTPLSLPRWMPLPVQIFIAQLKRYAQKAGIEMSRVNAGTWRQTAWMIHQQPGGFAQFVKDLAADRSANDRYQHTND